MLSKEEAASLGRLQRERRAIWNQVNDAVENDCVTPEMDREMLEAARVIDEVVTLLDRVQQPSRNERRKIRSIERKLSSIDETEARQINPATRRSALEQLLPELNDQLKYLGFKVPYFNVEVTA